MSNKVKKIIDQKAQDFLLSQTSHDSFDRIDELKWFSGEVVDLIRKFYLENVKEGDQEITIRAIIPHENEKLNELNIKIGPSLKKRRAKKIFINNSFGKKLEFDRHFDRQLEVEKLLTAFYNQSIPIPKGFQFEFEASAKAYSIHRTVLKQCRTGQKILYVFCIEMEYPLIF